MVFNNCHLPSSDTGAHIAQTVVESYFLMEIIRYILTCLGGVEHDFLLGFQSGTNQCTAARGGDHLVAIETHDAIFSKSASHLAFVTRTESFS